MSVTSQLAVVRETLPANVTLVAVSKMHPASMALEAYQAGQRDFGENKVQELVPKYEALPKDIRWHLIGHLQTNKVKQIVPFVHMIQSVDSLKLLEVIAREAQKVGRTVRCLIQVHIAREEAKFGFPLGEAQEFLQSTDFSQYPNVQIAGLMGMGTLTQDMAQVKREFTALHELFKTVQQSHHFPEGEFTTLSMGMTSDYPVAIEAGSTMVRVGSAIFGQRDYSKEH